eukprot:scaffold33899_cov51-Isochrysis_galbana.AAC.1
MGGHTLVHGGAAQPALNELMAPVGVGELAGFVATIVVFVRDRRGILLDVRTAEPFLGRFLDVSRTFLGRFSDVSWTGVSGPRAWFGCRGGGVGWKGR